MAAEPAVTIALRIPGPWGHPQELIARLPAGCRLTPDTLSLPDGTQAGFGAARADGQFAQIFRSSLRQPATEEELAVVDRYAVNVFISGPGGSKPAALRVMRAAAAVLHAGGAGVFVDNGALAHGGRDWLAMTDEADSDALSFAFTAIVGGKHDVWTMGLHALGLPDVIMKRSDVEDGGFDIVEVIRYLARGDKPVGDGHVIADLSGPKFRARAQPAPAELRGPMHNPFGRLRLVSLRDAAEMN
jgi:hypothetical protein